MPLGKGYYVLSSPTYKGKARISFQNNLSQFVLVMCMCMLLANVNSIVIPDKVQKGVGLVKLSIASTELQNNHSLLKKLTKVNIAGDREYRIIQQAIAIT